MLDIAKRSEVIFKLLETGTPQGATYAALECRLAIEYLCYERMRMALGLASYEDMGGWQPGKVVKAVERLVDEHVTAGFTISIAAEPLRSPGQEMTLEELQNLAYHQIGAQSPLDLKKLTKLWNALAKSALHVQVPRSQSDQLAIYGDVAQITEKVKECLGELQKVGNGTLLSNGFGKELSITCDGCGYMIKRRVERLKDGQTVSCVNPDCEESYILKVASGDEGTFVRRTLEFKCEDCDTLVSLQMRKIEKLGMLDTFDTSCAKCAAHYSVGAHLYAAKRDLGEAASSTA